jgi:hypothetical protein
MLEIAKEIEIGENKFTTHLVQTLLGTKIYEF